MTKPPKGWRSAKLDDLADLIGGGTPSRKVPEYFGGSIPWVTPTDLAPIGEVRRLGDVGQSITTDGLSNSSAKLLPAGTVLYSSRASIGKIAVADRECATNQGFANFVPKPDQVDSWFLAYLLCRYTPEITDLAGKTTFKEVSKKKLRSLPVSIPDLPEQRRIVARIEALAERIDEVRSLRSANLSTVPSLLPSLLREAFETASLKFEAVSLGDLALDSRYGTSEKCSETNDGTPVLRIPNVADRRCNFDGLKSLPRLVDTDDPLLLEQGDLLVVRTNGSPKLVGRCAVVPPLEQPFGYASYLIRFRLDPRRVRPQYAAYYLSSAYGREQITERRRTSAGQFNINGTNLKTITIPLPPLEVQDALIARMDRIDATVRDTEARMNEEARKDQLLQGAILRKAFAGEL